MSLIVVFADSGVDYDAGIITTPAREVDVADDVGRRAGRLHPAVDQPDHVVRETGDFGDRMTDVEDGNRQAAGQCLEVRQDLAAVHLVERGHGLIHQE
jgi:hypothetical protein